MFMVVVAGTTVAFNHPQSEVIRADMLKDSPCVWWQRSLIAKCDQRRSELPRGMFCSAHTCTWPRRHFCRFSHKGHVGAFTPASAPQRSHRHRYHRKYGLYFNILALITSDHG